MSVNVVAVITAAARFGGRRTRSAAASWSRPRAPRRAACPTASSESVAAPGTFITIEEWSDPSDLDKHLATEHIQGRSARVGERARGGSGDPPADAARHQ